jgi:uncharacterized protein YjdB
VEWLSAEGQNSLGAGDLPMILHRRASALFAALLLPAAILISGCGSLKSISILPVAGTVTLTGIGQTVQFNAFGASQTGNANPTTSNITTSVTWSVSNPYVAAISSTGDLTAVGPGYTQVLAQSGGFIATSDVTVTISSSGGSSGGSGSTSTAITGITIIPGSQTVAAPGKTAQFLAIGTNSAGVTSNLTNLVAWSSSSSQIATIGSVTGLATAVGAGTDTITAIYTNQTTGGIVTGTATFVVAGGTSEQYTGVQLLPGSQSLSASGQTGQFIALGTAGSTGLAQNVTTSSQIIWSSSVPSIATVSSTGLVTGLSAGNSTITALLTNADGSTVSATAAVSVAITAAPEPILALEIIPSTITVGNLQDTGQFLAIGTFSTAPYVRDLTNSSTLTWISSAPTIFPVNTNTAGGSGNSAGLATAYGNGTAVIIAEAKATDGTIQTATSTFNCPLVLPTSGSAGSCFPGSQAPALLATLTVFNEGANTSGWLVTAASATGTANVIHCGPGSTSGGSVCVSTYPVGTVVTLTAPAEAGVAFGGWTYNCTPTTPVNANGPNTCTVTLTTNDTVGGIFN